MLVFAGPGAGKTLGALLAFRTFQQAPAGHADLRHRTSILHQWLSAAERLGLNLQEWPWPADGEGAEANPDSFVLTYQGHAGS